VSVAGPMGVADDLFSRIVRELARHRCARCRGVATDCAHIVGRAAGRIRTDERNALALCRRCHNWYTGHPKAWREWIEERSPGLLDELGRLAHAGEKLGVLFWRDEVVRLRARLREVIREVQDA
jgi:hypothetical protein